LRPSDLQDRRPSPRPILPAERRELAQPRTEAGGEVRECPVEAALAPSRGVIVPSCARWGARVQDLRPHAYEQPATPVRGARL